MSLPAYSNYKSQRNTINSDTTNINKEIVSEQPSAPFCLCISDSTGKNLWVVEVNTTELKNNDITIHGPAFHFIFEKNGVSASSFDTAISGFTDYDVVSATENFGNLFESLTKIEVYGRMNGYSSNGYLTLANILENNTLDSADDYEIVASPQTVCCHTGALVALIMSKNFGFLTYDSRYNSCIAGNFNALTTT